MPATRTLFSRLALIFLATCSADARAEVLNPLDFSSLGTLNLISGSFTIDTDTLTIVDDAAPGAPLFIGVIDDQRGLADSFGPGRDNRRKINLPLAKHQMLVDAGPHILDMDVGQSATVLHNTVGYRRLFLTM